MINNNKMKKFSEGDEVAISRSRGSSVKRKERYNLAKNSTMSSDTKDFIQKICYRKTASIDMTQYGFITDSKVNPVNYVLEPLRAQLGKIRVKPMVSKQRHLLSPSPINISEVSSPKSLKPSCTSKSVKQQCPSPTRPPTKTRTVVNPALLCGPAERNPSYSQAHHLDHPKSALSNPGKRSIRPCVRKVRIQNDPTPISLTPKQVTGTKITASPRTAKQ